VLQFIIREGELSHILPKQRQAHSVLAGCMVTMMHLGPTPFIPTFKAKPWGGRALARVAGKALPCHQPIGESWELADHPHGMSVVAEGPLAGLTLRQLMERHGVALMGRRASGERFPLLVKTLHARRRLSVQVHPDDRTARAMRLNDAGKTEAWYVLDVSPTGKILVGLKHRSDVARLRELAASGELTQRLRVLHPCKGDAVFCPAGAVHALGPGVVLLEIQQNSDSTFRLHDWGRTGLDGKSRELHLNEAVRAVDGRLLMARKCKPKPLRGLTIPSERLIACDKFIVERWHVDRPAHRSANGRFEILYVVSGTGHLLDDRSPALRIRRGSTVLIPACVPAYRIVPSRSLTLIRVAEPE